MRERLDWKRARRTLLTCGVTVCLSAGVSCYLASVFDNDHLLVSVGQQFLGWGVVLWIVTLITARNMALDDAYEAGYRTGYKAGRRAARQSGPRHLRVVNGEDVS